MKVLEGVNDEKFNTSNMFYDIYARYPMYFSWRRVS